MFAFHNLHFIWENFKDIMKTLFWNWWGKLYLFVFLSIYCPSDGKSQGPFPVYLLCPPRKALYTQAPGKKQPKGIVIIYRIHHALCNFFCKRMEEKNEITKALFCTFLDWAGMVKRCISVLLRSESNINSGSTFVWQNWTFTGQAHLQQLEKYQIKHMLVFNCNIIMI